MYDVLTSDGLLSQCQIANRVLGSSRIVEAGWALLISLLLYIFSYVHQKHHIDYLMSSDSDPSRYFPGVLYTACNISVANFVFDIPGWGITRTVFSHYCILVLNALSVLVIVFYIFAEEPFVKAWGCYPDPRNIQSLNFGMCPFYFDRSEQQQSLSPVCDQPGVRCDQSEARAQELFAESLSISQIIITHSVVTYISSISPRYLYWKSKIEKD